VQQGHTAASSKHDQHSDGRLALTCRSRRSDNPVITEVFVLKRLTPSFAAAIGFSILVLSPGVADEEQSDFGKSKKTHDKEGAA